MFTCETITGGIRILSYTGTEPRVEVPVLLQGLPVTEIGDYCFSETPITHLALPKTVTRMGRYALYRCGALSHFSFWDGLRDFGAGTFTGCHKINRLTIDFAGGETSGLKDVLMEVAEELLVEYRSGGQTARLIFPEFFEEGVENTPARIIEHHTHGSGMLYRNCFVNRQLQFQEYDRRFPYALGQEREELLLRLVTNRLRYPYGLTEKNRKVYESFLTEHSSQALDLYTRLAEPDTVSFLMGLFRKQGSGGRLSFDL